MSYKLLNKYSFTDLGIPWFFFFFWQKNDDNSISDTSSSSLIHRWYIHDYYDYQTADISHEMKTMLHAFDYPVYELRKVPDDAEILQGKFII